jgi:hypothetical protein
MTHKPAEPSKTIESPDAAHSAEFLYAGEIRFGPPYYVVRLDGLLLRRHLFGKRHFGAACLWSNDSRYLTLSEWHSLLESRGPDTQVIVIDIPNWRECTASRTRGGFAEPARFEGTGLVYTKTSYDKDRKANVETCALDLAAGRAWRKVTLRRP